MLPIILLGVACAFLLESDSPPQKTENPEPPESSPPPETPLPPDSPPGPPIADLSVLPRGISPLLFRKNAREVASELQPLFIDSYELDHKTASLRVINFPTASRLGERMKELERIARSDAWAAREYNRPEIVKYDYFMKEEPLAAYTLVKMGSDPDFLEKILRKYYGELVKSVENPFEHSWLSPSAPIVRSVGEDLLNPVLKKIGQEEIEHSQLISDPDLRKILNDAGTKEIIALDHYLVERYQYPLFNFNNPATKPSLFPLLDLPLRKLPEESQQDQWRRIARYIPFLIASRGVTSREFNFQFHLSEDATIDEESLRMNYESVMAAESADHFDDALYGHLLQDGIQNYLQAHPLKSPIQKGALGDIQKGMLLFHGLSNPLLGETVSLERLDRLFSPLLPQFEPSLPLLSLSSLEKEIQKGNSIEAPLSQLPVQWQDIAQDLEVSVDGTRLRLWDFLRQNVSSVIFTPRAREGEAGTVNPLTRTVVLEITPNEPFNSSLYFSTLAHEAYHLYFERTKTFQNPTLQQSRLLNERNAYLFQSRVDQKIIELLLRGGMSFEDSALQPLLSNYFQGRVAGLAANAPLGFPENDAELHSNLRDKNFAYGGAMNAYPLDFTEDYLAKRGGAEAFLDAEMKRLKENYRKLGRLEP